ncbi:competence type IV pilus minor pilin ComGE [Streptococcus ruminantium]|uniref:competence type IV pilus minor pilin ComGE n=1 Tax=Streptococcus ruminantium TaxID=1917441 RepID=UPI0012DF95D6|nr:competence type IV pilus minor pilin ComGE [Streptococcus ruminantium]
MVVIKNQKNKAYVLLESLVALAVFVAICSLLLSAITAGRRRQAWELKQQEILNLAQMAVQTKQHHLVLNGVEMTVQRSSNQLVVFHEGKEVLHIAKN